MKKTLILLSLYVITNFSIAQSGPKWSTGGNGVGSAEFLGTTNSFALLFKVNNALKMTLNTNGTLQLNNFSGSGLGLVKYDNNGVLVQLPFATPSDVLYGNGTFGPINFSGSGWSTNGSNLFYNGTGNVGIGTNTPLYKLDVNGNIRVTGTVFTSGVLISNQVQAGTASLGAIDATSTAITGTATVAGNVGIGTVNPSAKLDVIGNANVSGTVTVNTLNVSGVTTFTNKILTSRITGLPGDSLIRFGDSTMLINYTANKIYGQTNGTFKGTGVGYGAGAWGIYSTALGYSPRAYAPKSVAIGAFVQTGAFATDNIVIGSSTLQNPLINNISNSLIVGFNSDIPTLFVESSNGSGTIGRVGIGNTSPSDLLQVGRNSYSVSIGELNANANLNYAFSYIGFNAHHVQNVSPSWSTVGDGANSGGSIIYSNTQGNIYFASLPNHGASGFAFTDAEVVTNSKMVLYSDDAQGGSPQFRLTVNGNLRCKELDVETGWADYVLKPNHKRMNYLQKEKYILINGHLPEITDGATIEKEGLKVGSIMKGITINVEENTLDVIELYKLITELKSENKDLRKRMELLEKK